MSVHKQIANKFSEGPESAQWASAHLQVHHGVLSWLQLQIDFKVIDVILVLRHMHNVLVWKHCKELSE
jgi:hypothetical protein